MQRNKKAMLAAGLLAGMAALTGCTAETRPAATPQAAVQQTAQPQAAEPEASPLPEEQEAQNESATLTLIVDGKETEHTASEKNGDLLLPLIATGEALGWKAQEKAAEEEAMTKHEITLQRDDSRITVSYEVSDNTIRRISWQKDGLLIPVNTSIVKKDDAVYVPAAFFEEATGARIAVRQGIVEVSSPEPMDTPQTNQ